eukprot:TRINITY_DN2095_c0_g1_i3.p1 TRINITY_DN2095_c0_g1~~TRINITY_DN2095_c0_g1_i3.p1  ORF type:complete len:161 (-),score=8.96 TRINITY_DN2095_c0_g1_i3:109-591(-)
MRYRPSAHLPDHILESDSNNKWYKQPRRIPHITALYLFLCICVSLLWHPQYVELGYGLMSIVLLVPTFGVYVLLQVQTEYDSPNTFRCPLVPALPCLLILCNTWMLFSIHYYALGFVFVLVVVSGVPVYFMYSVKHSRLNDRGDESFALSSVDEEDFQAH